MWKTFRQLTTFLRSNELGINIKIGARVCSLIYDDDGGNVVITVGRSSRVMSQDVIPILRGEREDRRTDVRRPSTATTMGRPTAHRPRPHVSAAFNLPPYLSLPPTLSLSLSLYVSASVRVCVFLDSSIRHNRNISGVVFSVIRLIHGDRAADDDESSVAAVKLDGEKLNLCHAESRTWQTPQKITVFIFIHHIKIVQMNKQTYVCKQVNKNTQNTQHKVCAAYYGRPM